VSFSTSPGIRGGILAELFDALELATILAGIQVFCVDESTTNVAHDFGLRHLLRL